MNTRRSAVVVARRRIARRRRAQPDAAASACTRIRCWTAVVVSGARIRTLIERGMLGLYGVFFLVTRGKKPTVRRRRLVRELQQLQADETLHPHLGQLDMAGLDSFSITVAGPEGTPYERGAFRVHVRLPDDYPFVPPVVRFLTRCFHPNVDPDLGDVCLDLLKQEWTPALTLSTVLLSIVVLLGEPNAEDPLSQAVADLMLRDPGAYKRTARLWTERYAVAADGGADATRLTDEAAGTSTPR